jgi:hypothetical protein
MILDIALEVGKTEDDVSQLSGTVRGAERDNTGAIGHDSRFDQRGL